MDAEDQWRNAVVHDLRNHLERIKWLERAAAFHGVLWIAFMVILIVKELIK